MLNHVTAQQLLFTASIIITAVLPRRIHPSFPSATTAGRERLCAAGHSIIRKEDLPQLFSNLRSYLNQQHDLRLFFEGALVPAAPFLLFRLKREGFSCSIAWVDKHGLYIEAKS